MKPELVIIIPVILLICSSLSTCRSMLEKYISDEADKYSADDFETGNQEGSFAARLSPLTNGESPSLGLNTLPYLPQLPALPERFELFRRNPDGSFALVGSALPRLPAVPVSNLMSDENAENAGDVSCACIQAPCPCQIFG